MLNVILIMSFFFPSHSENMRIPVEGAVGVEAGDVAAAKEVKL